MNILRYYVSAKSTNLRHWTVRAVAMVDGKEVDAGKEYFKGIKRDCKLKANFLNRGLKHDAVFKAVASGNHIGRLP